ncbi:MAG: DUF3391 domain-containing protein [Rhodocyclaceae bacterium]|nr:DUF3391 domain-containing protein [Rhodocyclaceae bacterium]
MKETISTRQIEQGMFVTELDRPWLETPFLLQGFLVNDAAQIAELQKYCATVTIVIAPCCASVPILQPFPANRRWSN